MLGRNGRKIKMRHLSMGKYYYISLSRSSSVSGGGDGEDEDDNVIPLSSFKARVWECSLKDSPRSLVILFTC